MAGSIGYYRRHRNQLRLDPDDIACTYFFTRGICLRLSGWRSAAGSWRRGCRANFARSLLLVGLALMRGAPRSHTDNEREHCAD